MKLLGRALRTTREALGAIAYVFALRLLVAWVVSSPLARTLSSHVAERHPRGDAILFDAGGLELLESVRLSMNVLASEVKGAVLIGSVLGWLSLVPAAGLLAALSEARRTGPAEWTRRGIELLPRFTLLFGGRLLCQGVIAALAAIGLNYLERRLALNWDERRTDLTVLALILPVVGLVCACGVFEDLMRAEVVRGARLRAAAAGAWALLRSRFGALAATWLLLSACALALPLLAAPLVGIIDVSRPGSQRVVGVTLLHQAVVFALVALRALWLAVVLELGRNLPAKPSEAPLDESRLAPGPEGLAVDLQIAASGPIPTDVETHDAPPEPRQ